MCVTGEKEKRLVAASVMAGIEVECADWHTIKVRHGNEFVRCLRAQGCKLAGSVTCEKCKQVGSMRSYTKALYRIMNEKRPPVKTPEIKRWMMNRKVDRLVAQVTRLKAAKFEVTHGRYISVAAMRGDLRVVARRLDNMARQGLLVGREKNALEFVRCIVGNLKNHGGKGVRRRNNGTRFNETTSVILGLTRKLVEEKGHALLSRNISGLPSESTSRAFMQREPFNAQLRDQDFQRLAGVYRVWMDRLGLVHGSVQCMVASDESAVNALAQWDPAQDAIVGYCGHECAKKCVSVQSCRKGGCKDTHACMWEGNFVVSMNRDYGQVKADMDKARVGTLARVVVINPLCPGLPKLVCLWTATCKAFNTVEYTMKQDVEVRRLFMEYIEPVVGRCIGVSSDGDSTRRKYMMGSSYLGVERPSQPMLPGLDSFVFTCARDVKQRPVLISDQCFVHNWKKLFNNTASPRRRLQLGPHGTISVVMLCVFLREVAVDIHGVKLTDTNRVGFRSMDFPSVARVVSPRTRNALRDWMSARATRVRVEYKAILVWLEVQWTYLDIFMSTTCSLELRIQGAGMVVTFLVMWRYWAEWFVKQPGQRTPAKLDEVFISQEAYTDVVMSCHFVVMLIMIFRDEGSTRPIPFRHTGGDCCEDKFSLFGGFVNNKRTYTVCEALHTIRTYLTAKEVAAEADLFLGGRRSVGQVPWEEFVERCGSQVDWPTNDAIKAAWNKGAGVAKQRWLDLDGKPYNGPIPGEWKTPVFEVGVRQFRGLSGLFRSEEELMEADFSEDDDRGEEGEGGGGDGSDDSDGGDDGDAGDGIGNEECVAAAVALEVVEGMERGGATRAYIEVPGRGPVHKRTICAEASSGTEHVSGDRMNRAAQAASRECVNGGLSPSVFDINTDPWVVQLGSDFVCCFEEDVWVGNIFRIRRKYDRGGYQDYILPVDLHEAVDKGWNLEFTAVWYTEQPDGTYVYGTTDTEPVGLEFVACPVSLTEEGGAFRISDEQAVLVQEAREALTGRRSVRRPSVVGSAARHQRQPPKRRRNR